MDSTTRAADGSAEPSRPRALRVYTAGAAFLGVSALYGGLALVRNPRDDPLGMPLEWLDGTPFRDYLLPGLVLGSVFGVGSFLVLFGVGRRRPWAWLAAVALGVAQVSWIVVQIAFLRKIQPLHLVYGGLGVALTALAMRPSVRAYLNEEDARP